MLEPRALVLGTIFRRARSFAGLAVAIVPFAIAVHLIAEAAATGHDGIGVAFVARHAYFIGVFAAAIAWFAATVGVGAAAAERRRRWALVRADLAMSRTPQRLGFLIAANLGFFALTQGIEGNPMASGSMVLGLVIALSGSLLAALLVHFFGSALITTGFDAVIGITPIRRGSARLARHRESRIVAARHATSAYSLFIPNRPPPVLIRS